MRFWGEVTLIMDLICWFLVFVYGMRVWRPLEESLDKIVEIPLGIGTRAPILEICGERLSRGPTLCNRRSDL